MSAKAFALILFFSAVFSLPAISQTRFITQFVSDDDAGLSEGLAAVSSGSSNHPLPLRTRSRISISFRLSSQGAGFEWTSGIAPHLDLRVGVSGANYSTTLASDGIHYNARLHLRSTESHLDIHPFRNGFRISPGALYYLGAPATAHLVVPGGKVFSLQDDDGVSDPANPITGTASLRFRKLSPSLTMGSSNLLPSGRGHHFTLPIEVGVAFQGSPSMTLKLSGGVCDPTGTYCAKSDEVPEFRSALQAERLKINREIARYRFYPIVAMGFGYTF